MSLLTDDERRAIAEFLAIADDEVARVEFFIEMKLTGKFPEEGRDEQ